MAFALTLYALTPTLVPASWPLDMLLKAFMKNWLYKSDNLWLLDKIFAIFLCLFCRSRTHIALIIVSSKRFYVLAPNGHKFTSSLQHDRCIAKSWCIGRQLNELTQILPFQLQQAQRLIKASSRIAWGLERFLRPCWRSQAQGQTGVWHTVMVEPWLREAIDASQTGYIVDKKWQRCAR